MTSENQPPDGDFSTPKQEAPELGLDFLAGLLRGKVHLTAIHDNKPMKARIVSDCNERDETWVKDLNEAHYNIYFTPNLVRDEFKGLKPAKSDITSARVLHVDIDDASELTRQKIKGFEPKPSLVVFSGGGYHLYWLLSEFSEKFELVEKINASLAKLFGGDAACHNIDRLMRLPLTTNWPNAKKRKSGRTPSAAFVDLGLGNPAARYKLDDIANLPDAALPPEGSLNAPMPEKFRIRGIEAAELLDSDPLALILTLGDDPERPRHQIGGRFPSRSEADWFVTCELLRLGLHPEVVLGILLNPTLGISERFLEKPKPEEAAWRQILKARAMVEKGWPERRKDGRPIRSLLNALEACVRLEIIFEFDRFHNRKRVGGHSLQEFVGDLSDDVVAHLHGLIIDTFGFDPGKGHLMDAVHILCLQRSFHPIREYLSELYHRAECLTHVGDSQAVRSLTQCGEPMRFAMAAPIDLRNDFDSVSLRRLAKRTRDATQSRRLLALAEVYDGGSRTDASRIGGVGLQIIRDWVLRFNARGPDGLVDGKSPGAPSKLNADHRRALAEVVEAGPVPAVDGVVRWRRKDLARWLLETFAISLDETTAGRELKALGFAKISARPRHYAQNELAVEAFKKNFPAELAKIRARLPKGVEIELWWQDEARIGQKNKLTRRWARRGTRPRAPRDQRTEWAYIFGAICPAKGKGAGLVMPWCDTDAMAAHLIEISAAVDPGAHAVLIVDQAGWHLTPKLAIPDNITVLALPPRSPELNPVENVWQFMRDNWLSNRIFKSYEDIVALCCQAWNNLIDQPWKIMSLGMRKWAHGF